MDSVQHNKSPVWKKSQSTKKSWSELKATVSHLRLKFASLSSSVPLNITFRTLSDGRVRIYFLSNNSWETTLLYTDMSPSDIPTTQR